MAEFLHPSNEFLQRIIRIIEENIGDDQFGVPDLAAKANMSRSNLLRKVKKLSGLSVIVFIRKVRLHHARQLLRNEELTASEISFQVGFKSTSYFTKCFREEFGYTPGERQPSESSAETVVSPGSRINPLVVMIPLALGIIALALYYIIPKDVSESPASIEKTIAVLPFTNDSDDSSNVYFINGMMQTILNNLQQIEDLKVTSRTTVEKYRNSHKSIPELARELEVNYFVEGSGQKVNNQVLLSIQLIDARTDSQVWSRQYREDVEDVFRLQTEVARNIALSVQAIITPEEQRNIEKQPTESLVAYDYYLQGLDKLNLLSREGLLEAVDLFQLAIDEDQKFASAYAYVAVCYYYLDIYQNNKQYGEEINLYADKAILYDAELTESQIAKGLYFMNQEQYDLAVRFLEKALSYSPNAGWIHNFLSDIYTTYIPDTEKYLSHALRGIQTAVSVQDSTNASFSYLHLSNALVQTGFIMESDKYLKQSLAYDPENLYSAYLQVYVDLAKNFNLPRAKRELLQILKKDTTRVDILQEVAKLCYIMEDYPEAWVYYDRYLKLKEKYDLYIFPAEDIKIAFVLEQLGNKEKADSLYQVFMEYAENETSIYKSLNLSAYYAAHGDIARGMQYLKEFTQQKDFIYWIVLFLDKDPVMKRMSDHPEFAGTIKRIQENFWATHRQRSLMLEQNGVLSGNVKRISG